MRSLSRSACSVQEEPAVALACDINEMYFQAVEVEKKDCPYLPI